MVENLVGVTPQPPPALVLQSFKVFSPLGGSPGPAKIDGAIAKDVIDKAEDKNSFFIVE